MNSKLYESLKNITGEQYFHPEEPMKNHTTFRVGGPAPVLIEVTSADMLQSCIKLCNEYEQPWYIMGNGSNMLISDKGTEHVILLMGKAFSGAEFDGTCVTVKAGTMLASLAKAAAERSLGGLVFASGIPGTLGGAVYMNAGAYGGEMRDIVESVTMLTREGEYLRLTGEQMRFGYRSSIAAEKGYIVLEAVLRLHEEEQEELVKQMAELREKRTQKQPLDKPSAGSTFKRPEGYFAGKLIQDAGLSGYRVGGAMVSPKHCGFVVNDAGAAAEDIYQLICDVQKKVFDTYGVKLEPEVKMLGDFS